MVEITRRYNAILKVNEIARTRPTTTAVFNGMCAVLRNMVPCDLTLLSLYDSECDDLRVVSVYGSRSGSFFHVGQRLARKSTQSGWAFEHKAAMFRGDLAKESRSPVDEAAVKEGYVACCAVPLVVCGDSIGVITVAAAKESRLSMNHIDIVQEISNQIALAISSRMPRCAEHPDAKLVCPKCIGAAGGKVTVSKHRQHLSNWGKKGGRGHKRLDFT